MRNKLILIAAAAAFVTGCSGKNAPDEFLVLKNAPLAMPPGYHVSPGDGNDDLIEVIDPKVIAQRALFGQGQ